MAHLPIILCLTFFCLSGCGKKTATVKGKVTFKGQPLTAGNIAFVGKDRIGQGTIKTDGSYIVSDAPLGEVTITVTTPPPPRPTMGPMNTPKRPPGLTPMPKEMVPPDYEESMRPVQIVPAPEQYSKAESSPLKYTVKPGVHEHNIDLTP